jgi:hypothetical protein
MIEAQQDRLKLQAYLVAGERLLWAGRPRRGFSFSLSDLGVLVFGLVFLGFACFWTYGSYAMAGDIWFSAFGIPFILVGLYLVFGWPMARMVGRNGSLYGVTDQRILRLRAGRLAAMTLEALPPLSIEEMADGTGTIHFSETITSEREGFDGPETWYQLIHGIVTSFDRIENARFVFELIQKEKQRRSHDAA